MKQTWVVWGALAGLAAWLLFWRKGAAQGGIMVDVSVSPPIYDGLGPYGVWTLIQNTSNEVKTAQATVAGDIGGIVLAFSPPTLSFTLAPGETKADTFWFYVPAGTIGLVGHVLVNVDGASDNVEFVVESLY